MDLKLPDVAWEWHEWTLPRQLRKLNEETGEVAEAVATGDWPNMIRETLDFIQVGHTMLAMVQQQWLEEFGCACNMDRFIAEHIDKLYRKGYLDKKKEE